MIIKVPQGGRAPLTLSIAITPADPSLDLTTVTGVVFDVLRQDGVEAMWHATIAPGATATSLTAEHIFAPDGSELPVVGRYALSPVLTVVGGTVDGTSVELEAESRFTFRWP